MFEKINYEIKEKEGVGIFMKYLLLTECPYSFFLDGDDGGIAKVGSMFCEDCKYHAGIVITKTERYVECKYKKETENAENTRTGI